MRRFVLLSLFVPCVACTASPAVVDCELDDGQVAGNAYLPKEVFGETLDPGAGHALITARETTTGEIRQMGAVSSGEYAIPLPPGVWAISAEHASRCGTAADVSVEVAACSDLFLDLRLEACN